MKEKGLEKLFKALGNRRRLLIIKILKENKMLSVGEIAKKIKLSLRSTSRHLSVLYGAEILDRDQINLQVFYSIPKNLLSQISHLISIL